jgi:hypothetical protein
LSSTRDALHKSGFTVEETVDDENGTPKRTGRLRLRVGEDDSKVTLKGKTYTKVQTEQMKGNEESGAKYYSND